MPFLSPRTTFFKAGINSNPGQANTLSICVPQPAKVPFGSQTWGLSSWRTPPITFSMVRTEAIRNHQEPGIYLNSFHPATPDSQPTTSDSFIERELTCPSQHPAGPPRASFQAFSQGPQACLEIHYTLPGIKLIGCLQFRMGWGRRGGSGNKD